MRKLCAALLVPAWVLVAATPAAGQVDLIINGGFETGDLSGWTTSGLGTSGTCPSANRDWNVGSSGTATGCSNPGNPVSGAYAAYNMFDANGNTTYTLSQTVSVPTGVNLAELTFMDALIWNVNGAARTFGVQLRDGFGALLTTVYSRSVTGSGSQGWTLRNFDVTPFVAALGGQDLTLQFFVHVPQAWTGGAGLGLDAVALNVTAVPDATVPEPMSIALMGTGLVGLAVVRRRRRLAVVPVAEA